MKVAMLDNLKESPEQGGGLLAPWRRFTRFVTDVRAELGRVTWPSRREVWATTMVVILVSLVFGLYLYGVDLALSWFVQKLFTWLGA